MNKLNSDLQNPLNKPTEQAEFPAPATNTPTDESLDPETEAWFDTMLANMDRMATDEEYRKEISKRCW
jgi:hypothetical protein